MGLRDEIRSFAEAEKIPVMPVATPELPKWDGQVYVTRVSPRVLSKYWKDIADEDAEDERAQFVVLVAADAAGSRIFEDKDVLWLSTCAILQPMIERLYWAGRYHNGLTEENRRSWQKNSAGMGGGGSPSSSAAPSQPDSDSTSTDS